VWADFSTSMLRAHELDWRGDLAGATIVGASVAWVSQPAGLVFTNLAVSGARTLVDVSHPPITIPKLYRIRCRLTDSAGYIHETEPPIEMTVYPTDDYAGPSVIAGVPIDAPGLTKTLTLFGETGGAGELTITTPATPLTVAQSVLFDLDLAPTLTKTFAGAPSDGTRMTYSTWFKRTQAERGMTFLHGGADINNATSLNLHTGDIFAFEEGRIQFQHLDGESDAGHKLASFQNRDLYAWYHLVCAIDTNLAAANDRIKLWINGRSIPIEDTDSAGAITQGAVLDWLGSTDPTTIGAGTTILQDPSQLHSLMAETNIVDGTAYQATDFGAFDVDGKWEAVVFSGVYGNNGSRFEYANSADFGVDTSGNGNNYTAANFVAADQFVDVPEETFPICVKANGQAMKVRGGGLVMDGSDAGRPTALGSIPLTGDKWYWECELDALPAGRDAAVGVWDSGQGDVEVGPVGSALDVNQRGAYAVSVNGTFYNDRDGGTASGLATAVAGDIWQIALDATTGKLWFGLNGTFIGDPGAGTGELVTITTKIVGAQLMLQPFFQLTSTSAGASTAQLIANFKARGSFAHTVPTGFKAISTANMTDALYAPVLGGNFFESKLYVGDGVAVGSGGQGLGGLPFTPDLVWVKQRTAPVRDHALVDSARGDFVTLATSLASAETTVAEGIALNAAGFTVGSDVVVNASGEDYVGWCFKKRAPGMDIVAYTGTGVAGATFAHNLSVPPELVMVKNRDAADGWIGFWRSWTDEAIIAGRIVQIIEPNPENWGTPLTPGLAPIESIVYWDNTLPSSTVVTLGSSHEVNGPGEAMIAYLFASVPGFIRCGVRDVNHAWCGFPPRWMLSKRMETTGGRWEIDDTALLDTAEGDTMGRVNYAGATGAIRSRNLNAGANTAEIREDLNFTSQGFAGGGTSLAAAFVAIAEFPFKKARAP
jgi:hypothetical protein